MLYNVMLRINKKALEIKKYLGVSLCNSVYRCCEYICSAFSAQQVVLEPDCGILGIVKVLASSTTRRVHNRAYS